MSADDQHQHENPPRGGPFNPPRERITDLWGLDGEWIKKVQRAAKVGIEAFIRDYQSQ